MQGRESEVRPGEISGARSPIGHLRRLVGLGFGLAVIVGSTIGVGILRTPGLVAGHLLGGSAILIAWIVGGIYTLLGAVCLAELGTMVPEAGGYYVYARRGFGRWVGFGVGWTDWLTYCTVLAYVSIGLAEFSGVLIPALADWVRPIAIVTLLAMVALQWAGLKVSAQFQEWTTAVKFLAFLALVVAAFTMSPVGARALQTPKDAFGLTFSGVILALQAVVIAYGGWQSALYFTEEDRDPSRNLPRAMIGGVVSVIIVYLLVNLALLAVLPIAELAKSTLPGADAAAIIAGDRGKQIITILSVLSLLPLLNAILMIGARILFAMGRDGLVSRRTASVNAGGTPDVATVVTTGVALILIASGTFQNLIALASVFLAANYCVSCLALVVLRRREPDAARPFRAWGYPWSAGIVVVGAIVFLGGVLVNDTPSALKAMGLLAVGLIGRAALAGKSITIHHEVDFIASPQRLYEALLDAKQFAAFSGRPAEINREVGGAFSVFAGHIIGRNLELVPDRRIVQAWRVVTWPEGIYSIAKFELQAQGSGIRLIFDHTGFPEDLKDHLAEGWKSNYWSLLKKYLP